MAQTGRREPLAAQVHGGEAGLTQVQTLGKRSQLPLPRPLLQAVRVGAPPQVEPVWSGAEPPSQGSQRRSL